MTIASPLVVRDRDQFSDMKLKGSTRGDWPHIRSRAMIVYPQQNPVRGELLKVQQNLKARMGHYFDRHPEVRPEQFFFEAIGREMERRESLDFGSRRQRVSRAAWQSGSTADDLRIHAWLVGRLLKLNRRRPNFWRRVAAFVGF
jgi:hypothetical protein